MEKKTGREPSFKPRTVLLVLGLATVFLMLGILVILRHTALRSGTPELPHEVISKIDDFQPYYYVSEIPHGFKLKKEKISLQGNVLFFQLRNARNQTITVTEQRMPTELSQNSYPGAIKVSGVDGTAIIKYNKTQVLGGLFSTKRNGKQTFVILTTTDPLSQPQIENMLRGLRPVESNE